MNRKTTLALLAIALALGAYIGLVDRRADTTEQKRERSRLALRIQPERVTSISVEAGELRLTAVREGDRWALTQPVSARADQAALARALDLLAGMRKVGVITPSDRQRLNTQLADYGLDRPRARFAILEGDRARTVIVGRETPVPGSVYVKLEDRDDILSTSTNLLAAVPASASDWRDRALFRFDAGRARRAELKRPDGFLQIARREGGDWAIQQPVAARADREAVLGLLDRILGFRVDDFVQDNVSEMAAFGLDDSAVECVVAPDAGDPAASTLLVGKPVDNRPGLVYARLKNEKSVVAVTNALLDCLRVRVDDLRDRRILALAPADVRGVRVQSGEKSLELAIDTNGAWTVVTPVQARADDDRVFSLIRTWTDARVDRFMDQPGTNLAVFGFSPASPRLVFSLADSGSATGRTAGISISTLEFATGQMLVKVDGEESIFRVTNALASTVVLDPLQYRNRNLLSVDPATVRRVAIARNGVEQVVERDTNGVFQAVGATGMTVRQTALQVIFSSLHPLRAARLEAENTTRLDFYGLDKPSAVLTIGLTGEAGIEKALLFGRPEHKDVYAMIRGQDVVFVLGGAIATLLQSDLYEKTPPPPPPGATTNAVAPAAAAAPSIPAPAAPAP